MDPTELRKWLYQNYPAQWQVIGGGAYIYTPGHDYHVYIVWPTGMRLKLAGESCTEKSTSMETFVQDFASLWADPAELAPDWLRPFLAPQTP